MEISILGFHVYRHGRSNANLCLIDDLCRNALADKYVTFIKIKYIIYLLTDFDHDLRRVKDHTSINKLNQSRLIVRYN